MNIGVLHPSLFFWACVFSQPKPSPAWLEPRPQVRRLHCSWNGLQLWACCSRWLCSSYSSSFGSCTCVLSIWRRRRKKNESWKCKSCKAKNHKSYMSWWMQKTLEILAALLSKITTEAKEPKPLLLGIYQSKACGEMDHRNKGSSKPGAKSLRAAWWVLSIAFLHCKMTVRASSP